MLAIVTALAVAAAAPCSPAAEAGALQEAIRLLDADRYRDAAELLHGARCGEPSADAALLEGICRYELGQDAEAERLLRVAEADPVHRESARLYLGLVALREGSAREATALFEAAAANPAMASFANDLARSSRWDGPLLVSVLAEGGYDSNVTLTSAGVGPMTRADALGGVSALVVGRPFGANGLFLRAGGSAQKYGRLGAYDFTLLEGAAGWRWWHDGRGVTAEYAYADRTLGGDRYLATHRLLATGAWGVGPVELSGAWQGRWERFATAWAPYTGFAQRADGRASLALGPNVRLGAGWTWGRDDTDEAVLAWSEQGPRADLRVALGRRVRVSLEVGGVVRQYDRVDPKLGERQRDVILDAAGAVEYDLSPRMTLRVSLLARRSDSNVAGFDYTKIVPTAGLGVVMTP